MLCKYTSIIHSQPSKLFNKSEICYHFCSNSFLALHSYHRATVTHDIIAKFMIYKKIFAIQKWQIYMKLRYTYTSKYNYKKEYF